MNTILIDFAGLFLDENGNWFHGEKEFTNERISKLFHENIVLNEAEKFVIKINQQEVPFNFADSALWVKELTVIPEKSILKLFLTNGQIVIADQQLKIQQSAEGFLYFYWQKKWKVKFNRITGNQLLNFCGEENGSFFFLIGELKIPIEMT